MYMYIYMHVCMYQCMCNYVCYPLGLFAGFSMLCIRSTSISLYAAAKAIEVLNCYYCYYCYCIMRF